VNEAAPVDSDNLLGLLDPEYTGSMILSNFDIAVFTELRCVTSEKRPEAIKVYV
jgi:hypothetical protein